MVERRYKIFDEHVTGLIPVRGMQFFLGYATFSITVLCCVVLRCVVECWVELRCVVEC